MEILKNCRHTYIIDSRKPTDDFQIFGLKKTGVKHGKTDRVIFICFFSILVCTYLPAEAALSPGEIISQAAILIDADTGQVLFEKNSRERMYPASTTKIMTALLTVQNAAPYEIMTASGQAVAIDEPDSSNIALREGEQLSVEEGLYALMLASANDAANVLAEHVAGSQESFIGMMNQNAAEIGAKDTRFQNAHGLHEPDHYTTAFDLALITRYAVQNPAFLKYFGAAGYTMAGTNLHPEPRSFTNLQSMLVSGKSYYDPAVLGGKTGFTYEARNTMSTFAAKDGRSLICVVLYSRGGWDKYQDTQKLLDYGFSQFQQIKIPLERYSGVTVPITDSGKTAGSATFTANGDFSALIHQSVDPESLRITNSLPESFSVDEPIYCTVTFTVDPAGSGMPATLGEVALAADMVLDLPVPVEDDSDKNPTFRLSEQLPSFRLFAGGALLLALTIAALRILVRLHTEKKHRKRRMELRNRAGAVNTAAPVSNKSAYTASPPANPTNPTSRNTGRKIG